MTLTWLSTHQITPSARLPLRVWRSLVAHLLCERQDVLAARVDRLAERNRDVLQTAALIGKEFSRLILERVVDLKPAELTAALTNLESAEFIFQRFVEVKSSRARHLSRIPPRISTAPGTLPLQGDFLWLLTCFSTWFPSIPSG
jgi:hypothetical protein